MTVLRRIPAAAAAGMLALFTLAPPASAAEPMVEWTRPTIAEDVLREPGSITGTITGEEGQGIENVGFELIPETPASGPDDPCFVEPPDSTLVFSGDNASEDFDLELVFPCNRSYELVATVGYSDGSVTDPLLGTEPVTSGVSFSVAIPPAEVAGFEATFDEVTKEVRLAWAPNVEPDLLGYFVERNPPGPAGFTRITPDLLPADQTSFVDPGIEDEHRYQVVAVRRGPSSPLDQIQGEASPVLTAGPERTEPALPDDIPAPNSRPPAPSGGGGSSSSSRRAAPAPSQTRPTSNIFEETLPFDPSQTTLPQSLPDEPPEDAAVLAEFDDEAPADQRATMVPIAGGLALVVGAMHLFLLSKRAGEPDDIPMSRPR